MKKTMQIVFEDVFEAGIVSRHRVVLSVMQNVWFCQAKGEFAGHIHVAVAHSSETHWNQNLVVLTVWAAVEASSWLDRWPTEGRP